MELTTHVRGLRATMVQQSGVPHHATPAHLSTAWDARISSEHHRSTGSSHFRRGRIASFFSSLSCFVCPHVAARVLKLQGRAIL
eukprot:832988-Pyramimonas_sp.AAC.1